MSHLNYYHINLSNDLGEKKSKLLPTALSPFSESLGILQAGHYFICCSKLQSWNMKAYLNILNNRFSKKPIEK